MGSVDDCPSEQLSTERILSEIFLEIFLIRTKSQKNLVKTYCYSI